MNNHIKSHNKVYTAVLFFIASVLIFTSLVMSNGVLAQPSSSNKLSKVAKCASGDLPPSACKKVSDQSQVNSGSIGTGPTSDRARTNTDGGDNGVGATGSVAVQTP